jgi:hypothetical protein
MREAFQKTKAEIYMITNLVSTRNETHNFAPINFVNLIEKYTGIRPTGLIVPNISRADFEDTYKEVASIYDLDHSHFLGWDNNLLEGFVKKEKVKVLKHDATIIVETIANEQTVRHSSERLSLTLNSLI